MAIERTGSKFSAADERFVIGRSQWETKAERAATGGSGGKSGDGEQFWSVYVQRLQSLKRIVTEAARRKWPHVQLCQKVSALAEVSDPFQRLIVVGTLVKRMQHKLRVLDLFSSDSKLESGPLAAAFGDAFSASQPAPRQLKPVLWSPGDRLEIEDETARIQIIIDERTDDDDSSSSSSVSRPRELHVDRLVSGVVVGLCGCVTDTGEFHADDIVFAEPAELYRAPAASSSSQSGRKRWLAMVSCANLASTTDVLRSGLLFDYLAGVLGDARQQADIVHVLLAGGVLHAQALDAKQLTGGERLAAVDAALAELAACVDVTVMPSCADPANLNAPQQPLNACLFPLASRLPGFRTTTNPTVFRLDEREFLGDSGDIVASVRQATADADPLQLLHNMLRWRHMAPVAPDLHPCYPLLDFDPFVVARTPNVMFTGAADSYSSRLVNFPTASSTESTLLLALPSFDRTGTFVLVELGSLQCIPVTITHPIPLQS